ncbi:MAG: hypothetical protein AAGG51_30410 [Cyanobacteria bacterium P01_G01_bin.54]
MVSLWLEYAQEFLGKTCQLPEPKVCINYNRWCWEENYRRELAKQLQIPYQQISTDKVSGNGGGSSFDGFTFDGKASQMKTQVRWQNYQDQLSYQALFKNTQLWDYSYQRVMTGYHPQR